MKKELNTTVQIPREVYVRLQEIKLKYLERGEKFRIRDYVEEVLLDATDRELH